MPDAIDNLVEMLKGAVVRVLGEESHGSGVWLAPGHVLTCAHVAMCGALTVEWAGRRYDATIVEAVPRYQGDGDLWPFPDIAVLRVSGADTHPCAWLSDRPVSLNARLVAIGYPQMYPVSAGLTSITGKCQGSSDIMGGTFIRFVGDEVAEGMSGGPVLDLTTGAVCGLIKSTRQPGTSLGGLVVPLAGLRRLPERLWCEIWRAHDGVHADGEWARTRQQLADAGTAKLLGPTLSPSDEVTILGVLSRLPVREDPATVLRKVLDRDHLRVDVPVPLDVRDVLYELANQTPRPGELFGPVRLAISLSAAVSGEDRDRLRDWAVRVAEKLGQSAELEAWHARPTPAADAEPTIVVQLESDALKAALYRVTMWVHRGDRIDKPEVDAVARPLAEAKELVRLLLTEQLRRLQGQGTVEFVLPAELFDEGFDELITGRRGTLGNKNPVVIRDLERLRDPSSWHDWRLRWWRLRDGTAATEWLDCAGDSEPEQLEGRFHGHDDIGLLGLTRGLDEEMREALDVALNAGIPAAVWRRRSCVAHPPAPPEEPCIGHRFRAGFERKRSEHHHQTLPYLVKRLRNAAAENPAGADFRDIVLLWDDPERLPEPFVPLAEPTALQGAL
ncbi:trypsin-like peptidase domain-containing protein [Micromonospora sp. DSM 115977]|uniref:Trypsin-like peptidase domain-containing protein n=1 Tax=Micromonospora reichwaldensis TaxID=3075516 RepID=A0ABU2WTC8_9ACTN|nr:trypsin-like peptidase domain-containing protein [Micromonospora sp. DSM 115977]MDT0529183.1 trypsin-like peptidase domain-containing protein [Micromonospora sp. DSM 115977]